MIHQLKRLKSVNQSQIKLFLTEKMEMECKLSQMLQEQPFMYKMKDMELREQITQTLILEKKDVTNGYMHSQKMLCHH
jgi:hypothetical protein